MSYQLIYMGHQVFCDTAEEVHQLIGSPQAANAQKQAKKRGQKSKLERDDEDENGSDAKLNLVIKFLETVAKAGREPVGSEQLIRSTGCGSTSALGGIVSNVHRELEEAKMPFDSVAIRRRDGNLKVWTAGPKINDAIEKLKNKEGNR